MAIMRRIIESRHWLDDETGSTASIYGAVPWISAQGSWKIVSRGWVIEYNDNGRVTVGDGRPPFATREDAQLVLDAFEDYLLRSA